MKAREFAENPSRLTWDNVNAVLRRGANNNEGFTATEVGDELGVSFVEAGALLRLMFDAGGIARVRMSKNSALYFYIGG
jgi:hypothetical protein